MKSGKIRPRNGIGRDRVPVSEEQCTDGGGCSYKDRCRAPSGIAERVIILAAITIKLSHGAVSF